jgi:Ni,Fe-hydrogenase III large subunit/Ni,Fe-hydrogenase III component G
VPETVERLVHLARERWKDRLAVSGEAIAGGDHSLWTVDARPDQLVELCRWLSRDLEYDFATLNIEQQPNDGWLLLYVFYADAKPPLIQVRLSVTGEAPVIPSLASLVRGPAADWHEREAEDLFGICFEGHPRLGEFILHEDWPEGINPMRRSFDGLAQHPRREEQAQWEPPTVLVAPGAFSMPVGPVFSDFAESAHFLLETVGEDVVHTIPRFFYKYRGVEKIAEGQHADRVLLLAERFSGTAAFGHGLAFCQAVEAICGAKVSERALWLRSLFAEVERLRHHTGAITAICHSTALAVAAAQAALIEEDLLRLSAEVAGHRYLFGVVRPGGVAHDVDDASAVRLTEMVSGAARRLHDLHAMLRYSSSFLDRLEQVGAIDRERALTYGLVGPVGRASGIAPDMRKVLPYGAYRSTDFSVPHEEEGDGYARLRLFFAEADQSAAIIRQILEQLPTGPILDPDFEWRSGTILSTVEVPAGAAFHYLRLGEDGVVERYHITPPSFANWHGFHLAAENFAFQDFPIILASFGLSNAECDR